MSSTTENHLAQLSLKTSENISAHGVDIIIRGQNASKPLILWLQYLREHQLTGNADCLIDATLSAAREAIACLCLGLVRPALSSFRAQIDMSLAWLYFKDHSVEWQRVQDTGDGFKMKTELLKYLGDSYARFSSRFGLLRDCKTRQLEDPFRLLSAHIHGQSELALPCVQLPEDIVATRETQLEAIELQRECAEFITDVFWSVFANRWAALPRDLKTTLDQRFKSGEQRAAFFA